VQGLAETKESNRKQKKATENNRKQQKTTEYERKQQNTKERGKNNNNFKIVHTHSLCIVASGIDIELAI
jgi:hypothetical protein